MRENAKHVVIVGAGPGGLTAAMILARRGFRVSVFEKEEQVGGRNGEFVLDSYRFDIGPTFLMMKFILDEMFLEAGRRIEDYLDVRPLEPMYELRFADTTLRPSSDRARMRNEIERVFPGQGGGFERFMAREAQRFAYMYPCLQKDYSSFGALFSPTFLRALPHLSVGRSLYDVLGDYFSPEALRLAFTFQSKYLGMSPWSCPGAFAIIPYIEYAFGVHHVIGGLSRISEAMASIVREYGGVIHLAAPVRRLLTEGYTVNGVELEDGRRVQADAVVINADFAHAMSTLVEPGLLRSYTPENLRQRDYSCSTFMLYLGLDTTLDLAHHTIVFAHDYRANLDDISRHKRLSQDLSVYVRNASVSDPTLALPGHSALYLLVPVPNNSSGIDWEREKGPLRERVLDLVAARTGCGDLRQHIRAELVVTPDDWEKRRGIFRGATFNLAHSLDQMLYFRPHNRFEELTNCYLVGGGTHPGSGLPTIYESGRISSNLICSDHGVPFAPPVSLRIEQTSV